MKLYEFCVGGIFKGVKEIDKGEGNRKYAKRIKFRTDQWRAYTCNAGREVVV